MKRFGKLLLAVSAVLLLGNTPSFAQTSDLGNWNTFSLDKKLNDKISLGFDAELRFKSNLTRFNLIYTNFSASYKITDWLKVTGVYRFIDKNKDDGYYGLRHRVYGDLAAKYKTGKFSFAARTRVQWEFRAKGYAGDVGNIPEVYWRNKFDIKYKLTDRITPYIAAEFRWQLRNPRIPYNDGCVFDRNRAYLGLDYEINHDNTIGLYYMRQSEFNVEEPETLHIIGLEYSLSLD